MKASLLKHCQTRPFLLSLFSYSRAPTPALAARSFLQTGREALAENFAPGKAITPFLRQTMTWSTRC